MSSQPARKPGSGRPAQASSLGRLFASTVLTCALALSSSSAQQFTFRQYGQDEGLRNLDVFALEEDPSGLLWLATENGLFRYDGSGFRRFGPQDSIGESLALGLHKDSSGRTWVTTNDHLYYFNGTGVTAAPTGQTAMQFGVGQRITSIDASHLLFLARGSLMLHLAATEFVADYFRVCGRSANQCGHISRDNMWISPVNMVFFSILICHKWLFAQQP